MTKFADLFKVPEFDRIKMIAETAETQIVGVLLEKNQPEKIARYIKLVTERNPKVRHIATRPGITKDVVLVQFGPLARQ